MMNAKQPDKEVEFIELHNDDFYAALVELAKGIIVDCMQVVKTVTELNAEDVDEEAKGAKTAKLKEALEVVARYGQFPFD